MSDSAWTENSADHAPLVAWREIWGARELVGFFAARDLKVRYKQAVFGVLWVVVQPVVMVAGFSLAFDRLAHVGTGGLPYPVFAFVGLICWNYISQCVGRGSEVLVINPALVSKVYIPRLVAPIASVLPGLVDFGVALILLVPLCAVYGVRPGPQILFLPVLVVLLVLTAAGPVMLLAALNVRFRDVRQIVPPLLQAMLFFSPVAYAANGLRGIASLAYALNPAVAPLDLARWCLIDGAWPGWRLAVSLASMVVVTGGSLVYFQRAQRWFADVI